jgi:Serine/threonine protein kinase
MDENSQGTRRVNVDHYIGKTLDKYVLTESLGRGGMGLVFKAEQKRIKRFVAIKILPPARMDEVSIKRLEREATAMGNMKHPHIATLFDFGMSEDKQPYLVMELIEGRSLKQLLKDSGGMLEADRVVAILIQICDAMDYAHANGVIHRDLKPDNVMLANDVHADFVKILDFGIAKSLDASVSLTKTGQMVGSPVYMSPEQCTGKSVPDHRSDIYSLGSLLYECLTGVIPLKGDTYLETVYRKTNDTPDPFPAHLDDCKKLEELVFRCLQADPSKRPQSMEEVRAELMRFAGSRSGCFDGAKAAFDALQASGNQRTTASQMMTATVAQTTVVVEQPQPEQKDNWRPTRHDLQLPLALTMASMFIVTVTAGSLMVALKTSLPGFMPPATPVPNQQGSMDDVMTHGLAPVPVKATPVPANTAPTAPKTDDTADGAPGATVPDNSLKEPLSAPQRNTSARPKAKGSHSHSSAPTLYSGAGVPSAPVRTSVPYSTYESPSHTVPEHTSYQAPPKKGSKIGTKTKRFLKKIRNTIDQVIRD